VNAEPEIMWDRTEVETWLAAWDCQGTHRTATLGDEAGADWLSGVATALGAIVTQERFALDRIDPIEASVALDGTTIEGVALFDAPDGLAQGKAGLIGQADTKIGVGEIDPRAVYSSQFRAMREAVPHAALVLATVGEAPGLALLNAELFPAQYGPPILQVASEHAPLLVDAARRGASMHVTIRHRRRRVGARNVFATVRGSDPGAAPLVVMTPRSSWWTSTAERGGGLVCWLACLKAVLAAPPIRDVVFTANSGHELGHIGLDAFTQARPGWEHRATWLHWGANIGAAGGQLTVMSGHDDLRQVMSEALTTAGQVHAVAFASTVPSGESRDLHRDGGRYITLVGSNKLFHLSQDRLPHAVDTAAVRRSAAAAARIALLLSR
jgi:hypothetical protein